MTDKERPLYEQKQFIADLWYIVRRLRDSKEKADYYGVRNRINSAQTSLAKAVGHLESTGYGPLLNKSERRFKDRRITCMVASLTSMHNKQIYKTGITSWEFDRRKTTDRRKE